MTLLLKPCPRPPLCHLYEAAVQGVDEAVKDKFLRQGSRRVSRPRDHTVQLPVHVILKWKVLSK